MMDFNIMGGAGGSSMMFFAWTTYLLVNVLVILGIVALWKYVSKK